MAAFIGRKSYLEFLERMYEDPCIKGCAILGRRRIGKSALMDEFVRDKDHIVFQFINSGIEENLEYMSAVTSEYLGHETVFRTLPSFFLVLGKETGRGKLVVVFDEYPYIADARGSVSSMLQNLVDCSLGDSKVLICGSSVKIMEKEISDYDRPLFGRFARLDVHEMDFEECARSHPQMDDEDLLRTYLAIGGVLYYHIGSAHPDFQSFITDNFLNDRGFLAQEGENAINRELSPSDPYYRILDSIRGDGADLNHIINRSGMDKDKCIRHVRVLADLGILSKVHPMAGAPKKPYRYEISDPMMTFTFQVLRRRRMVPGGNGTDYSAVSEIISTHLGRRFEIFCRNFLVRNYPVREISKWWGQIRKDGGRTEVSSEERDIDIVADIRIGSNDMTLYAECKFRNDPVGISALKSLDECIAHVRRGNIRRMIISKSGFTDELVDLDGKDGLFLVDMDVLLGRRPVSEL